ncbi:hypothetical protein [Achromobacter pestifer]|uniref:Glycosyltransferase RgtA/B/C/D-like domain-containing protein n=1 Tax=Achromobacter pestifer TaxID=1353889 RepID=A0A6S6ZQE1_9BURK|nr:hypothetical protein [Achromobacter pestifer]CAB3687708.1 hypothetical protein LMG3431_04699 [Achromobacter pestifer]
MNGREVHARPAINRSSFSFLLLLAVLLLIPRLDGWDYSPGKYLWAEDGSVFINDAQRLGVASIWQAYQGYLHAYPRIVAYLAGFVDLSFRPLVLLAGWCIAYVFMAYTLIQRSWTLGVSAIGTAILLMAVAIQPNVGEVFFTLTNTQWLLAAGFAIILLTGDANSLGFKPYRLLGLSILGLTGPFSVVILPVLTLRALYFKDLSANAWIYVTTLFCACIQAAVLLNSPRLAVNGGSIDLLSWAVGFGRLAFFSVDAPLGWAGAITLWIAMIVGIASHWAAGGTARTTAVQGVMLTVMALLLLLASMYSAKSNVAAVIVLGSGSRYTWVPYTLILFALWIFTKRSLVCQLLIGAIWLAIALPVAHRDTQSSLQFGPFADFSKYQNVVIPLHPLVPEFPGWYIEGVQRTHLPLAENLEQDILISRETSSGGDVERNGKLIALRSTGNDPILIFENKFECPENTKNVAVETEIRRSVAGAMQLFWAGRNYFSEVDSLKRWYPEGLVKAQFAFPYMKEGLVLRLDPMEVEGTAVIESMTLICLPAS